MSKRMMRLVARVAMLELMDERQGNNVFDDGTWDELYKLSDGKAAEERRRAEMWLEELRATLVRLGVRKDDETLALLMERGKGEIEERYIGEENPDGE